MTDEERFFASPQNATHRKYEALRAFYFEKMNAKNISEKFGYTLSSIYSLIRDFKKNEKARLDFFITKPAGRKPKPDNDLIDSEIINLRKKYLSIDQIKSILDAKDLITSKSHIQLVLTREEFAKLPRRDEKALLSTNSQLTLVAPVAKLLEDQSDEFSTTSAGILCFIPIIKKYGVDKLIQNSSYPETETLPRLNSVLSFLALKLSNFARYSKDDLWCMDRGAGLFAGLNVLPKAAWLTSYSHRVSRQMNLDFLKSMEKVWHDKNLLSDTINMDFTSIPYWGDASHLENNWSGKRNQSLSSFLAVLAQDPASGIITYGDTCIRHKDEANVTLEFLDFYKECGNTNLKYLVFDSKFTTYQNLNKLDDDGIKFLTIRRRGKSIVEELEAKDAKEWKKIKVKDGSGKNRSIKVIDEVIFLKSYGKDVRQIAITGNGKIKPALIITNDFDLPAAKIVRKYARRWLVEKGISESIHFFHLNRNSSSVAIKIDFDLTMTILSYNLYRIMAMNLEGYNYNSATTIFDKFIKNSGSIMIDDDKINVELKKKRNSPVMMNALEEDQNISIPWMNSKKVNFTNATHS